MIEKACSHAGARKENKLELKNLILVMIFQRFEGKKMKVILDTNVFISGIFFSAHLQKIKLSEFRGIAILNPRDFVGKYL